MHVSKPIQYQTEISWPNIGCGHCESMLCHGYVYQSSNRTYLVWNIDSTGEHTHVHAGMYGKSLCLPTVLM